MWKATAVKYSPLAILFVLVVAILRMSRYAETRKDNHQKNGGHVNRVAVTENKAAESTKEANQAENSPSWIDTFAWPNGVTAWALLLTLFVIAWQSTETHATAQASLRQSEIQSAGMRQWVDLRPDGLFYTIAEDSPDPPTIVTIHPRWKVVNNTPLPFTLLTMEAHADRSLGWEISEYDVYEVIPPIRDGHNYLAFTVPVVLDEQETAEFFGSGVQIGIEINVIYTGANTSREQQGFGEFYICRPGSLTINESLGKGPQRQRIEKDDSPSTIVRMPGRAVMGEKES